MTRLPPRLFVLVVLLASAGAAVACPNCKEAIPTTDVQQASSFGSGMNLSIYYMFAGFFLAIGICVRAMYKGAKSAPARIPVEPSAHQRFPRQ